MIRPEDVADLRPGDVVEYSGHRDLHGAKLVGPLHIGPTGSLCISEYVVRQPGGGTVNGGSWGDPALTIVSRAPRPLYVNHDRTEPVPGDVVRQDGGGDGRVWLADASGDWWTAHNGTVYMRGRSLDSVGIKLPDRLRLLVDGETGQVVP